MSTPAGWYPDPSGGAGQRYWDGQAWAAPAPPPVAPTAQPGYGQPAGTWGAAPAAPPYAQPGYAQPGYPQPGYPQQQPYGYPQQGYAPAPYAAVGMKQSGIALLLSFIWPGAGHLYVEGPTTRAILYMVGTFVAWLLWIVGIGVLISIGLIVWTMIDSYNAARAWNVAHGFPPG